MIDLFENTEESQERKRKQFLEDLKKIQEDEARLEKEMQMKLEFKTSNESTSQDESEFISADEESLIDNSEDPVTITKYWHDAQNIIIKKVEKGKMRNTILGEKKLYLKNYSNTTDSKFTFKDAAKKVFNVVDDWIATDGHPIELAVSMWELNEDAGFHKVKKAK
jgi:hypothetical protein